MDIPPSNPNAGFDDATLMLHQPISMTSCFYIADRNQWTVIHLDPQQQLCVAVVLWDASPVMITML